MNISIALQLFSVRDDMASDFKGTLQKVKDMGYDGVEFAGLYGRSAEEIKEMCKEIGLVPVSAHVGFDDLFKEIETYAEIGCKYVAVPWLAEEYRPGAEKFGEFVEGMKVLGERAKKLGMKLGYHNHAFEFEKVDGEYALDIIYREIPAELLDTQVDTCWAKVGGVDPAEYLLQYSGRAGMVHLKDFATDADGNFEFRPLGMGVQDFPSILKSAEKIGTEWVIVEEDSTALGLTALEFAKISVQYLKSL